MKYVIGGMALIGLLLGWVIHGLCAEIDLPDYTYTGGYAYLVVDRPMLKEKLTEGWGWHRTLHEWEWNHSIKVPKGERRVFYEIRIPIEQLKAKHYIDRCAYEKRGHREMVSQTG